MERHGAPRCSNILRALRVLKWWDDEGYVKTFTADLNLPFGGRGISVLNQQQPDQPANEAKRSRRILIVALIGLVAFLMTIGLFRMPHRESRADRFKQEVRRELPVGSTREQVMEWAKGAGASCSHSSWDAALFPLPPTKMFPEVAGVDRADLGSFMEISMPWGSYTVNGQVAENRMWVFLPLDESGRVKGHYFMTLAELAEDEAKRPQARAGR